MNAFHAKMLKLWLAISTQRLVEKEFSSTVAKISLYEPSTDKGLWLIGNRLKHLDIYKAIWLSPAQRMRNSIWLIYGRHFPWVLDVHTIGWANNSILVQQRFKPEEYYGIHIQKFCQWRAAPQTAEAFEIKFSFFLLKILFIRRDQPTCTLTHYSSAFEVLQRMYLTIIQECKNASAIKDAAYRDILQFIATRAVQEWYGDLRCEEKRLFKHKKLEDWKKSLMELRWVAVEIKTENSMK